MKTIILAISTTQHSPAAVRYALDVAEKEHARLVTLFVIDSKVPGLVFEKLIDMGFIGEKPSVELKEAVEKEYQQQADEKIAEIRELAEGRGLEHDIYLDKGDFFESTLQAIAKFSADVIVLTRARRSQLSRIFSGSAVDELTKRAPCEVKVFEEERIRS